MKLDGLAIGVLACAPLLSGHAAAADRRTWKVPRAGVTFELTGADLRAWTGDPAGPPVLSLAALLAAEKQKFDAYAQELARGLAGPKPATYGDYTMAQSVTFDVLSIVGTLVTYRERGEEDTPGAAHPSRYDVLVVRDVRRMDATPSLLDFFPEKQIVQALKADPWVRKFADPENGFERAASLEDLLGALDLTRAQESAEPGDCAFDVSFSTEMVRQFFFHHVEKDRVAVRIAVGPRSEWCNRLGGGQQIGLLLPIPESLRDDLLKAQRGEAGFLAGNPTAAGPSSYSKSWEVDIRTLVPH